MQHASSPLPLGIKYICKIMWNLELPLEKIAESVECSYRTGTLSKNKIQHLRFVF